MRLRSSVMNNSVPLRVALVRQGVGHRICFLSASEKENYALKKGLILLQRDKLFSRWKERYLILTKDYLACFKKSTKIASSAMGGFIFKLNLADVNGIEWVEKKEGGMIAICCPPEGRFFLRNKDGLEEWLQVLRETISQSKGRREALRSSMSRDSTHSQICDGSQYSNHFPAQYTQSDCPVFHRLGHHSSDFIRGSTGLLKIPEDYQSTASSYSMAESNRLSLLTDVDLHCDMESTPMPSPSSSCSNTSRHFMTFQHPGLAQKVAMKHRRIESEDRSSAAKFPEPLIIYTNPKSSPKVERSMSDAYQFEFHGRRCKHHDEGGLVSSRVSGHTQLCRRASAKPLLVSRPS